MNSSSEIALGKTPASGYRLDVSGKGRFSTSLEIRDASDNSGASMLFLGASGYRNFRIGNQLNANDVFEITPSTTNGGTTWSSTPAIAISGASSLVGIGTTTFTSTATGSTVVYKLNVEGNLNINGQVYQNNLPFVTSRWTNSTNGVDIHRLSRVGINKADPTYTLHVLGSANIEGQDFVSNSNNRVLYANADKQWLDTYGVFKSNRNTIAENITIPANINSISSGPISINNGITVSIPAGSSWSVV
jgi:hypothetical protein